MRNERMGLLVWCYAVTILVSAFLVFQVQPIISKTILPWFGGSPAVWTTCMLFFQVTLFAGYAYAHALSRLRPFWQAALHMLLLAIGLVSLPIIPDSAWKTVGGEQPTWRILALLTSTVGLPYFLLSSTGPLVQAWFSRLTTGRSPYRLYALSNVGSLAALITYPFVVEPSLPTCAQASLWSIVFTIFAVLCSVCAWLLWQGSWRTPKKSGEATVGSAPQDCAPEASPSISMRLSWLLLSGLASLMLLGTTNHVCQDVAVIPFLWIAPLSLYLLSFIICFDRESWYQPQWFACLGLGSLVALSGMTLSGWYPSLLIEIGAYMLALFSICMICHGELVRRKPSTNHLTMFYLFCAGGGAVGGILVALVCPMIFDNYLEMNLGILAAYLLAAHVGWKSLATSWLPAHRQWRAGILGTLFVGLLLVVRAQATGFQQASVAATRNFYGVLQVEAAAEQDPERQGRFLIVGRIAHGFQFALPEKRRQPTMYFDEQSGIGITLRNMPRTGPLRVGVVGLGVGALAAYGNAGDYYRFYEINPEVCRLANEYFTFLQDCPAKTDVVLGDARLSLEQELQQGQSHHFDLVVMDAFSGDAIPTHLVTDEAISLYLRHLRPDGVLAINISNHHLDMGPVLDRLCEHHQLDHLRIVIGADSSRYRSASDWWIATKNREFLAQAPLQAAAQGELGQVVAQVPLWTDQYNNLFQILK